MGSVLRIIKKNFKLLMRSRSSALMIILGPLLVIALVGLAFNNSNAYEVGVGVYSESYSDVSQAIVGALEEQNFMVRMYGDILTCKQGVRQGEVNLCMVFSPSIGVSADMDNSISVHVDYSEYNLAWMVLDRVSNSVSSTSSNLTAGMTDILLNKIAATQAEIEKDKAVLGELIEYNKQSGIGLSAIKSNIDKEDATFSVDNIDTGAISSTSSDMQNRLNIVADEVEKTLQSLRLTITGLDINDSKKKGPLTLINQTLARTLTMRDQVSGKNEEVQSALSEVQNGLAQVELQMRSIGSLNSQSQQEIDTLKEVLKGELQTIMKLQKSFNTLTKDISSIEVTNAESIAVPIQTVIEPITSEKTHFNYLFPSLLVMLLMFASMLLSSTLVVMEKTSKAFIRNFITPTPDIIFVIATYLTGLIIVGLQLFVIVLVSAFFIDLPFDVAFVPVVVVLLVTATFFILLGMSLGYLFKREEAATLTSLSLSSLFLLVSGVILPMESMPAGIRGIAAYNPFVLAEGALKKVLIFDLHFSDVSFGLFLLLAYGIIIFVGILFFHTLLKKGTLLPKPKVKK